MNKLDDSDLKKDVLSRAAHINTEDRLASEDTRKATDPKRDPLKDNHERSGYVEDTRKEASSE